MVRVPNVRPEDGFADVQAKVRSEIDRYFKLVLNRPEILNRIGDNILVFDFIRLETAALVFDGMVDGILADISATKDIRVTLAPAARDALRTACLGDLSNGGRGIRNKVESLFVNPLARGLFDSGTEGGTQVMINALTVEAGGVTNMCLAQTGGRG